MALDRFYPHLIINAEIWNVPKLFVAFGMILSLLEEESRLNQKVWLANTPNTRCWSGSRT